MLAEEQKKTPEKSTASKKKSHKKSKAKGTTKAESQKEASEASGINNENPEETGKATENGSEKSTESIKGSKTATSKGSDTTQKSTKKTKSSKLSKSSKPSKPLEAEQTTGRDGDNENKTTSLLPRYSRQSKGPQIVRRTVSKSTKEHLSGKKFDASFIDINDIAARGTLVKIIEEGNLSPSDTVKAVRSLRASLVRKTPSTVPPSHRQPKLGTSIKDGMLKQPPKSPGPIPGVRPPKRMVWYGSTQPKPVKTGPMKGKPGFEIKTVDADELSLVPIDKPQPPVPNLAHGLERVLFNPGVYHLQDPRSRVFNFNPYLANIMPASEFDFNALKQYITSSRDETLLATAKEQGKKYTGSTSSTTAALGHFHFLLSQWRPINTGALSQSFPVEFNTFTTLQRGPSAIFLRWRDGTYAIDADKEFDTANILSMLGKSMEKLLTLPPEDFEKYRKENSNQISEEERNEAEAFNYTAIGDFLLRSQLDAHDPRLPGTGMFDLKTRAVVSIRMDTKEYEQGMGYEIRGRHGEYESFEREYYDMIRAAFLKYSLQVRMGRMDGIFVAFHNTQRIFGFQYISLSEMDYALHGTEDTTIGDSEFKLSLELLNRVLDKATAKYPEKSLRLHFETRGDETPFMYIFAEPMEEEQIQAIQESNKAAVLEFEQNVLGMTTKTDEEILEEKKNAEWDSLRTKVEESMERDELDIQEARAIAEAMLEESGYLGELSAEEKERRMDELMASFEVDHQEIEGTAAGVIEEETEGDDEVEDGMQEDSEEQEEEQEDGLEDGDAKAADSRDIARKEGDIKASETEPDNEAQDKESGSLDTGAKGAKTQVVENEELLPDEAVESTDSEKTEDEKSANGSQEALSTEQADATTETSEAASPKVDVLAMTLTIRNKINGEYIERPVDLHKDDKWTVEYALAEIPQAERASLLYEATKRRRFQALSNAKKETPWNNHFMENLRKLSIKGREWREGQNKIDEAEGPPKVLEVNYAPPPPVKKD